MTHAPEVSPPHVLSLREVAAWDLPALAGSGKIRASVPALQRGLVWSPQQVEMLWDSILRGFPVGSLVVCPRVDSQERGEDLERVTHHLLDGQQRCNAIALGFADPFDATTGATDGKVRGNDSQSILWLDLAPHGTDEWPTTNHLEKSASRHYLIRVTTLAHPWGFAPDDDASRLKMNERRDCLDKRDETVCGERRPLPVELLPWRSNAPVPLGWLLAEAEHSPRDSASFWEGIRRRIERLRATQRRYWLDLASGYLAQRDNDGQLSDIYRGIQRALGTRIVALEVAKDVLNASPFEKGGLVSPAAEATNIEQLFNRLNRQGTRLDGEELAFSMIKAYWPGAAEAVERVANRRFPEARLASLAVRAALTESRSAQLARSRGISQLRALAVSTEANGTASMERAKIEGFLGVRRGVGAFVSESPGRLSEACRIVDGWLAFKKGEDRAANGLPPVLLSSFAQKSGDIYLFFLHLADRLREERPESVEHKAWKQLLPGVAMLAHWFALNEKTDKTDKTGIGDCLMRSIVDEATPEAVSRGVGHALSERLILRPRRPKELDDFIRLPSGDAPVEHMIEWTWPSLFAREQEQTRNDWKTMIERTAWERELMLYVQREYLAAKFPDYDPARRDLWEDHNRPWDIDHIFAAGFLYNKRMGNRGAFIGVCKEWVNCIGNLRAWPFELNRADGDDLADGKIRTAEERALSLIDSEAELRMFCHGIEGNRARQEAPAARGLCEAIKARYVRIYRSWYESAGIEMIGAGKVPG